MNKDFDYLTHEETKRRFAIFRPLLAIRENAAILLEGG
jgi:hypothetical protein